VGLTLAAIRRASSLLGGFDQGTTTVRLQFMPAPAIAKKARIVCEYGRCWQADAGYDYQYGYRPPTKWEQKGFCPPGQAKKGNC
jgi:hypothetical protein